MTAGRKHCPACGQNKPRTDFWRHHRYLDGLQRYCKPCHIEANALSRRAHPDAQREREKGKRRAWQIVRRAIRDGRLVRPAHCSQCGSSEGVPQGHHENYDMPLDVEWLCGLCHATRHRRTPPLEREPS